MGRLFISYAREDQQTAERMADELECDGHEVWLDRQLAGGAEYSTEIERALADSDRVIVLWSKRSASSPWVRDEAEAARDAGKLVPVSIDASSPPLGFRQFHTIDLAAWSCSPGRALPDRFRHSLTKSVRRKVPSVPIRPLPKQRIAFCRTADGVTLAYSQVGEGPPLVKSANWLNHLEFEWESPIWRHWLDELSSEHRLLRYDERGNGLSDWEIPPFSFDQLVEDLATVVDAAKLDRFDLIGVSQGAPVAVAFAVNNPERVRKMVLVNGFAAGWKFARDPAMSQSWEAMATLARTGWGKNNPAFRQMFTSQFFPDATAEQARWWNELQKKSTSAENASRFIHAFGEINVSNLLPKVRVPTMVMHCRQDQFVPFEAGRMMAARIPDAEFVAIESRNHLPLADELAWPTVKRELEHFLNT